MTAPGDWNVPGYTVVRQLGAGGGGRVVLAVHEASGARVAVKYLSEDLRGQPGFLARFRGEARLLVELDDPHVAQLYEYVETHQGAAIVMELVNGASLRALLRQEGSTGPEAALAVLKGSLLGLAAAHETGVVHRDYKPENVLVQGDGASKLVDFGIAVRAGDAMAPAGTPPYMAPEQWTGLAASPASDVYAATAVFFECLTGHRPYQATDNVVLRHQHQTAPVPAGEVPEPVRGLVERGMAKDPAMRPASAAMFVAELEEVAAAAYGADWEERGRRKLAAIAAVLAATFPLNRQPPAEIGTSLFQTVLRAVKRHRVRLAAGAGILVLAAGGITAFALTGQSRAHRTTPVAAPSASAAPSVALPPTPGETPAPTPTGTSTGTPTGTSSAAPGESPSETPAPPTPSVTKTPKPSPKPSPSVTPPPPTKVVSVHVSGLTLGPGGGPAAAALSLRPFPYGTASRTVAAAPTASGTVTVVTSGTAKVTLTVRFTVNGKAAGTREMTLKGAKKYVKTVSQDLGSRPCGGTLGMTATTTPAAGGGTGSITVKTPECPTSVTGVKVLSLAMTDPRVATAKVEVTTDGTGQVALTGDFSSSDGQSGQRAATLSGKKSYTRTLSFTFGRRPCETVTITATTDPDAPSGGASRTIRVDCPAAVTGVTVNRLTRVATAATTAVTVTTENAKPVQLTVTWLLRGKAVGSQSVTLSGRTSYTVTMKFTYSRLPCGTGWGVTAATAPNAASGVATRTKKIGACTVTPA
ncbi:serine/threonine-protein kinase [Planotetraspora sp. GP83]|uniref:serine/threonine-protein kinase n=1 Tax=Planotetraspora sp. GP83 TaxID=3156264 RepID=UPI003516C6AD